jgi:hypothetical protein
MLDHLFRRIAADSDPDDALCAATETPEVFLLD